MKETSQEERVARLRRAVPRGRIVRAETAPLKGLEVEPLAARELVLLSCVTRRAA